MDKELLEAYKKKRISLQKSFIERLNSSLATFFKDWEELPLIKQTIFRSNFDIYVNDISRKLKDETIILRLIKKTNPETVLQEDINNLITRQSEIPDSKNPYDWTKKFRIRYLGMDCFARTALFDNRIDCKDLLWEPNIKDIIDGNALPNLETKNPVEQAETMFDIVEKLYTNSNTNKYQEEPTYDFYDTISGQMSMNI